jgi:hypothetical protein
MATPLLGQEVSPESFLCRPSGNHSNFLIPHRRDDNQDSPGISFTYLNESLFAVAKFSTQIDGPIQDDLLGLFRHDLMKG